jgi:hypothetical protein
MESILKTQQTKLKTESRDGKKRPMAFFVAIQVLLASTSYLFGAMFLRDFWAQMLGGLPLSAQALGAMYNLLGGLSGVLITTVAKNRWSVAKLHAATTQQQYAIAHTAELISFAADLLFTVIGLVTMVGFTISADLRTGLNWFAVGTFILLICVHAFAVHAFAANDVNVWRIRTATVIGGLRMSEQLIFEEDTSKAGLLIASQKANDVAPDYAKALGEQWQRELLETLPVANPTQPTLPTQPHIKRNGSAPVGTNGFLG